MARRQPMMYCVHEGRPSWHQQRAGHVSAGQYCTSSKRDAERRVRGIKRRYPNEPAFIVPLPRSQYIARKHGFFGAFGEGRYQLVKNQRVQGTTPSAQQAFNWLRKQPCCDAVIVDKKSRTILRGAK